MATRQLSALPELDPEPSTRSSSSDLTLVPLVQVNEGWILSDSFLADLYEQIRDEGMIRRVFWDGSIADARSFIEFMKRPGNIVTLLFKGGRCAGYAWLTGLCSNYAFGHFCFLRSVWGQQADEAGRMYLDYWFSFPGNDGPLLDTILGMVPGFNKLAHQYVERIGFQRLGVIPGMLRNKQGDRDDAVIFYLRRE